MKQVELRHQGAALAGNRWVRGLGLSLGACALWVGLGSWQQEASSPANEPDGSEAPQETREGARREGEPAEETVERIKAFAGPLEEGAATMRRLAQEESIAAAEAFAQRLLQPGRLDRLQVRWRPVTGVLGPRMELGIWNTMEWLGWSSRTLQQRAWVHYDLGRLQVQEAALDPARESFEQAIFLAAGPTRTAALYNLGWLDLQAAEALYDQIPEVHGRTRSAMSPGFVPGQHQGQEEEPDYLVLSRAKYKAALNRFVQRLRIDWQHADTRANVEWIQRRLEALREIEEKRKNDEGQGMADDEPSEDPQDQTQDPQEDAGEQGAKSDQEQQPEESQENQQDQEGESGQENETQDRDEPGKDSEPQDEEGDSEQPSQEELEERLLTEEEIKRLLKRLEQHDKEGERLRQLVRPRPRGRVKKDW